MFLAAVAVPDLACGNRASLDKVILISAVATASPGFAAACCFVALLLLQLAASEC